MRFKPDQNRPLVVYRPRNADGSLGLPVPLNPVQALAMSGDTPDPVTLAEANFFRGLEGLGRFAMDHATRGAIAPANNAAGVGDGQLGELGFLPALAPLLPMIAEWVGAGVVGALASKGVEAALNGVDGIARRDAILRRALAGAGLHNTRGLQPGNVEADLLSGLASSSLAGASDSRVGSLGIFGRFRKKAKPAVAAAAAEDKSGNTSLFSRLRDGTKAGLNLFNIGKNLLAIRKKLKKGHGINASEALKWLKNITKQANELLGGPGEEVVAAHLAGAGEALQALEHVDRDVRQRRPLGWRPTLGEFGCACSRMAMKDARLRELARGVKAGTFDSTRPDVSAMMAAQSAGVRPGQEVSGRMLGELGAAGDFLQALATGASQILSDVQQMPVERAVLEGARTVLNDLVGATQQAQVQQVRVQDTTQRLNEFQQGLQQLQQQKQTATSLPIREGIAAQEQRVRELIARAERVKAESEAKLSELHRTIQQKRAAAAPVAAMVKEQTDRAMKAEANRVDQVNQLSENNLLRGHVMVLSRQEYADLIRRTNEAESAREKLSALAEQADKDRKAQAAKLADAGVRIVQLKQQLADLEKRAVEEQKNREIAEAIEANKRDMANQLRQMQDGFRAQIEQVRERTREAVAQAGDVVNQTGVQMMFQFVRDLTQSMRDIRDVSHTGEFLRLFPEVLDQLRTAQEIASPEPPHVDVRVEPSPAPTVNVAPPTVNVAPPNVNVEPPQFVLGPGFEIRPKAGSGGSSSGGGGGTPNIVIPPPVPANTV